MVKDLEGTCRGLIEVLPCHLPGKIEENYDSLMITSILSKIEPKTS
jgi:hypothetical protein